jgi:hypothetical protein
MYQPQAQDFTKPALEHKFKLLSKLGFTQVILQWSSYGEYDFIAKHPQWFEQLFSLAKQHNIAIYMGLYADPKYFVAVQKKNFMATQYLGSLLKKNKKIITSIYNSFRDKKMFKGWYIYDELNDVVWQKKINQKALALYLDEIDIFLQKQDKREVYISAYFTGSMSPQDYISFLHDAIPKRWEVLIQTGVGAGLVSTEVCQKYFTQFESSFQRKWMPIIEIFSFEGKKIQKDFAMYKKQTSCMKQRYTLFSWRYLFDIDFLEAYLKE